VAQNFALKTGMIMDQGMNSDLVSSCEDFIKDNIIVSKLMEYSDGFLTDTLANGSTPQFKDTHEVKFIRSNTKGGRVILTYKEFQYCRISPTWDFYWQCHFHPNLKYSTENYV